MYHFTRRAHLTHRAQQRFGFIGGTEDEYAKYFLRDDMCQSLWHYGTQEEVKAIAGMSTVPKKNPE